MFAITEAMKTKGKMVNVVVLSQKNRAPDENPGAKLSIEVQLPAAMLAHFAPKLPSMLFEAAAGDGAAQGSLEGVPRPARRRTSPRSASRWESCSGRTR